MCMKTFLGLGSNLGNKEENLLKAVKLLQKQAGQVLTISSFYYSEPWGFQSANHFVNIVILLETGLEPLDLLRETQGIERTMGRSAKSSDGEYADRIIDIDILLYQNRQMDLPQLKIPHPLMSERDFVMKPLREIAGEMPFE